MLFAFIGELIYDIVKGILIAFKVFAIKLGKMFTHNWCDDCGFTKDEVFVTEFYTESGHHQCMKCYERWEAIKNETI